jgi:CubicO group peptidase (beta-lactamase class C family)
MRIIRWIACVSVLSAWLMWHHSSTTAQPADLHGLDGFMARALQKYHVPGAAIAVVHDGQVVMAKGYGVRDVTQPGGVDEHTIFQLASVTKSLTGAAARADPSGTIRRHPTLARRRLRT